MAEPAPPTSIPQLYDDPANGDLILKTEDNVKLYVYKILLSLASPVFQDMFSLPQPEPGPNDPDSELAEDPYPVIPVAEDAETLRSLLTWVDPRSLPRIGSLEDIQKILAVASKYCMDPILSRIGQSLSYGIGVLCPLGTNSVRAYALAVRYQLTPLIDAAARASLDAKWEDLLAEEGPELDHVPASALNRLQQYRLACGTAAKKAANDWSWILDATGVVSDCEMCASGAPPRHWTRWWVQYMQLAGDELYRIPSSTTITSPDLAALPLAYLGTCVECGRTTGETYRHLARFNKVFIKEVDRVVGEVSYEVLHSK
ncbi:hypothetical protein HMN09_01255400 [Mycena chlorophos]|uniref:BTB domain-containing protein n=1 Tax=Mycena chlorophos TaxID=658473 RepID=A0A8H6S4F6_MYCCL|nr:hypothetical protein HMN09_01255400 [Mycena chlorophos]